ncbi:MAG TPA: acyltransferase domain-containing protein [Acidimicrobiales bacterium]|nr:acyltransferase domain-containing protein [Acidimicrobiales bacterium]
MPAFVFPGQGSQRPGMGRPWVDHPSWDVVVDASTACGRDLAHLLLDADADELTETRNAQLATVTLSMVVLDAVERLGIEPTTCAGHSVGEYTALVAAGALGFDDGVRLVAERGEAMQSAADASPGGMVVVAGTDPETVDIACRLADGLVWVANHNSPDEMVIAGEPGALAAAGAICRELGARSLRPVEVGGAFHTPLMAPARDRLRKALAATTFHPADVPVVANVDGRAHREPSDFPRLLSAQLCSPVRWHRSLMRLGGLHEKGGTGERLFVEIGPGGSLAATIARSLPSTTTVSLAAPADLDRLVDAVAGDSALHAFAVGHQGEQLYVSERLVVSPGAGVFEPAGPATDPAGGPVEVGTLLGRVGAAEVRSPFAGHLVGVLAHQGERVQTGQPIAWLRAS